MRLSKAELFGAREVGLAEFAAALSHPARIAIVTLLMGEEEMCCKGLVGALPLAQATVSQHLKALERVGLLAVRPDGVCMRYRLVRRRLQGFCHAFQETLGAAGE